MECIYVFVCVKYVFVLNKVLSKFDFESED